MVERIAFITGDSLGAGVSRFLTDNNVAHLEKPIAPSELRQLIEDVVAGWTNGGG